MSVIYLVLPLALVLGAGFLIAFLWATRQGQFDDLETPAIRLALEDDAPRPRRAEQPDRSNPSGTGRS